jgi:quercetin dioxygenase-like cupin family protein
VTRSAPGDRGELVAARPGHVELGDSSADLDAGAELRWQRDRHRITVHQTRGTVRWTIGPEDTLMIEPGQPGSAATIEASGASLRVEVRMNLSDMRLLGASALTAVAVSVVTVVVYEGHVKATSGGQTVNVTPGGTIELLPGRPPQPPGEVRTDRPAEPIAVGATPADVNALQAELRAAREQIDRLKAELAARPVDKGPPPTPTPAAQQVTATRVHDDPPPPSLCDPALIGDLMAQAQNQYVAGFARSALQLIKKGLLCQPNVRMYRLAATYACAAHDLTAAREMFEKVPAQFQPAIAQRCLQEGLELSHR